MINSPVYGKKVGTICDEMIIQVTPPKRKHIVSSSLRDSLITDTIGHSRNEDSEHKFRALYFEIIDTLLIEFENRFSSSNKAIWSLNLNTSTILNLVNLGYIMSAYNLKQDMLSNEITLVKHLLNNKRKQGISIKTILDFFTFLHLYNAVQIFTSY